MATSPSRSKLNAKLSAFQLSCWILSLIALVQLASIGSALALAKSKVKVVERLIEPPLHPSRPVVATPPINTTTSSPRPNPAPVNPQWDSPSQVTPLHLPPSPAAFIPRNISELPPAIADPLVEKLITEARDARIQGDNIRAIIKLEEASQSTPNDPNLLYEFATTHEAMGVYDKASDYYLRVYQLGQLKAGSLWKKSGTKLERGIVQEAKGLVNLGVCRTMQPRKVENGTIHGILAPIHIAPGLDLEPSKINVKVHFYEKNNNKVVKANFPGDGEHDGSSWLTPPLDWSDGEELVELWYLMPNSHAQERHLYGEREYYGHIIEIFYDDKLVDMRFSPRTLMNEANRQQQLNNDNFFIDPTFNDFEADDTFNPNDYNHGLLPPLPSE